LDLFGGTAGEERPGGADERDQAGRGQSGGHAHHVLLGDADVDEAVRVGLLEPAEVGRADRVIADGDDPLVVGGQFDQGLGECLAVVESLGHASSSSASATCSAVGTLWCHSTRSSMNETPLPLVVFATTATGLPVVEGPNAASSS